MVFIRVAVSAIVLLMSLNLRTDANAGPMTKSIVAQEDPCAELRAVVDRLATEVDFLQRQVASAESRQTGRLNSVIYQVQQLEAEQRYLGTLPERARQQMIDKLGHEVVETLAVATILTLSISVGGELLPVALHHVHTAVELAHLAHTASELATIYGEAGEAGDALGEAESMMGLDHHELRAFAREHEFTELERLIDTAENIPNIKRNLSDAWDRWLSNGFEIVTLQLLLDQTRGELQEAANALYLCEEQRHSEEDGCYQPRDCAVCWFCP